MKINKLILASTGLAGMLALLPAGPALSVYAQAPNCPSVSEVQALPIVNRNSSAANITLLQRLLSCISHAVVINGAYDAATRSAVSSFQTQNQITGGGNGQVFGPKTKRAAITMLEQTLGQSSQITGVTGTGAERLDRAIAALDRSSSMVGGLIGLQFGSQAQAAFISGWTGYHAFLERFGQAAKRNDQAEMTRSLNEMLQTFVPQLSNAIALQSGTNLTQAETRLLTNDLAAAILVSPLAVSGVNIQIGGGNFGDQAVSDIQSLFGGEARGRFLALWNSYENFLRAVINMF